MPDDLGSIRCDSCDASGLSPLAKQLSDDWYDHSGFGSRWTYEYGVDPDGNPTDSPPWKVVGRTKCWMYDLTQDEVDKLVESNRINYGTHVFVKGQGWERVPGSTNPTAE